MSQLGDRILFLLARSTWFFNTIKTDNIRWIMPGRVVLGLLLLDPPGGGVQHLCAACAVNGHVPVVGFTIDTLLRVIEILCGISFVVGGGIRITAIPTLVIFMLRAIANLANSVTWLAEAMRGIVTPQGDWATGALFAGAVTLLFDLFYTGSGRWSVDYLISKKLTLLRESWKKSAQSHA